MAKNQNKTKEPDSIDATNLDAGTNPDTVTNPDAETSPDAETNPDAGTNPDTVTNPDAETNPDTGTKPEDAKNVSDCKQNNAGTANCIDVRTLGGSDNSHWRCGIQFTQEWKRLKRKDVKTKHDWMRIVTDSLLDIRIVNDGGGNDL